MVMTLEEKRKYSREYNRNKSWFCSICNNGHRYTRGGKGNHIKSKMHKANILKIESMGIPLPAISGPIGRPKKHI